MDCVVEKSSRLSTQGSASWNDDVRNCNVARGFDLAGLGAGWAWASAVLPVLRASAQLDTGAGATEIRNAATSIVADSGASGVGANVRGPCSRRCLLGDQLVQLSVAGLVVAVAAPPLAVTPVNAGIEKKVFSHGLGAAAVMLASLVSVTVRGLPGWPDAATVTAVVRLCELPLVVVE
jgi:hypothetical protein